MLFMRTFLLSFRVLAVPGLADQDDRKGAIEKKRAYQLDLQRQVSPEI